jgi:hypothetical protein
VFVNGPGAEARNSIGIALVTGMLGGTLLTLIVVLVFYSLLTSKHQRVSFCDPCAASPSSHRSEIEADAPGILGAAELFGKLQSIGSSGLRSLQCLTT